MKNNMKKAVCGFMAAAVCLTGCGSSNLDGTQTVLTVNDRTMTLGTANVALRYQQSQMYSYYSQMYSLYGMAMDEFWDYETEVADETESETSEASETSETSEASEASETSETSEASENSETSETSEAVEKITYGEQFKETCMQDLEEMLLLEEHMEEYGVTFTEEDQKAVDEAAAAFIEANDADALAKDGITAENVAEYLKLYTIEQRMFDPMVVDVDTEVSDEEAQQSAITYISVLNSTYKSDEEEDGDAADDAAKEKAREVAESIYDAVKNATPDADLETIVSAIDEDAVVSTSTFGSDAGSSGLSDTVLEAARTLSDGEFYDGVIELDNAFWIVRMDAVLDRDATDEEKENIISDRKNDLYDDTLKNWKDASEITLNESLWKKVKVTDSVVYTEKAAESTEE